MFLFSTEILLCGFQEVMTGTGLIDGQTDGKRDRSNYIPHGTKCILIGIFFHFFIIRKTGFLYVSRILKLFYKQLLKLNVKLILIDTCLLNVQTQVCHVYMYLEQLGIAIEL